MEEHSMTFYARVYSGPGLALHTSTAPIEFNVMAADDVYAVTFEGEFVPSDVLLPLLTVAGGVVSSAGPVIADQAKI
jgi:hypothetical protein